MVKRLSIAYALILGCAYSFLYSRVLITPGIPPNIGDPHHYSNEFFVHQQRMDTLKRMSGIYTHFRSGGGYDRALKYAYALRHTPRACKSWSTQEYGMAAIELCAVRIPIPPDNQMPTGYVVCGISHDGGDYICLHDDYRLRMMHQSQLYEYDSFWQYVQQFDDYQLLLPEVYQWVQTTSSVYKQLSVDALKKLEHKHAQVLEAERMRMDQMQKTYAQVTPHIAEQVSEWEELNAYLSSAGLPYQHLERRICAYHKTEHLSLNSKQTYILNSDVAACLLNNGHKPRLYATNFGNQLQQALHQECIDIATQSVYLRPQSLLYSCKSALLDITDASREFNQLGLSHKTTMLNDFAYALLDCGSAIVEGVAQGIIYAAKDMMDHPLQTVLCVVAGEYVLAYHLAKVATHLVGIGITYIIDEDAGKQAWNEYIEPLTSTIKAFTKEELSVRDCIKGVATFGTTMVAQQKMLRGFGSLYNSARVKAIEFANKNPLVAPEAYMATPEGLLFKATSDVQTCANYKSLNPATREIVLPKVKTYEQARNKALEIIGEVDPHTGKPHIGKMGVCEGKISGMDWHKGKVTLRLDYDPVKGAHINITDHRLGKGLKGSAVAIPFKGTENDVKKLLQHINTPASLKQAKAIFEKIGDDKKVFIIDQLLQSRI